MIKIKSTLCLIAILMLLSNLPVLGGEETISFKAGMQAWFSYAPVADDNDSYGISLRRVRLKPSGKLSKNIKWAIQAGWGKQSLKLVDVFLEYLPSTSLAIKVGKFAAPGAVSGAITSSAKLDFVERSQISQNWNKHSLLSGYRALGVQVHGHMANKKLYYAFMLANARNTPKTGETLFNPSIKDGNYAYDSSGFDLWGRLEALPAKGVRVGGFYGDGKLIVNMDEYSHSSYGGHIYYVNLPLNFKSEYISGQYEIMGVETNYKGYCSVIGLRFGKLEPLVRYDSYSPNDKQSDHLGVLRYSNYTVGINYFISSSLKFQVNMVIRKEQMAEEMVPLQNNLFYMMFQYVFVEK
jgi:Phosphate-selective porin O and P